jgi:hypothetical protein
MSISLRLAYFARRLAIIRALISIAGQTRIRKIVRNRLATMLSANNVIDFMRESSVVLMKQAIFTSEHRPLNYFSG